MRPLVAAIALAALAIVARPASADLGAGASLSLDSITGPTDSPTYNYTITLNNTGDTDIGTFWYAWQPATDTKVESNFMVSMPDIVQTPDGWYGYQTGGGQLDGGQYDGFGIEWYNYFGSVVAAGDSQTFGFSSSDSPDVLDGNSPLHAGTPTQTAYVYIGFPQSDPGFQLVVDPAASPAPVPEPASIAMLACGLLPLIRRRARTPR